MPVAIPKSELNEFSLPRVCVVTGEQGPVTFQPVRFQWNPPWIAIFALAPLLFLIFMLAFRKTASGTLPFSDAGWEAVKAARRNVLIAVVGLIFGCIGAGALAGAVGGDSAALLVVGVVIVGILAVVIFSVRVRKVFPTVQKIDDQFVHLKLASPQAESLFQAHLSAGARKTA
jgi:hypothetical protein